MEFIDSQERADEVLDYLLNKRDQRAIYFDLEADNFHHYNEILCTVQICAHGDFYLLDAMNLDLTKKFSEVLREIPIWFHGCDYDLYLLKRFLNTLPEKLLDTQLAARLCGFTRFGYAPLVEQLCGIKLPKDSQRSDWTKRPLSAKMIAYAKNDVRYLPQISDILVDQLARLKRIPWLEESCNALLTSPSIDKETNQAERWRLQGTRNMKADSLRYVKALYEWRDAQAKISDKPHFKVINNDTLIKWVQLLTEGKEVPIPKSFRSKRKDALMKAISEANALPETDWPEELERTRRPRVHIDEEALDALIEKRNKIAEKLKLEGSFIASRKTLEEIIKDKKAAENLLNWQRELLQI